MTTEKIKDMRITIDRLAQLVYGLKPMEILTGIEINSLTGIEDHEPLIGRSHEIVSCYKSLLLAKAWLGNSLSVYESESPYKNDGNRHSENDIEPTDAKADVRSTENTLYGSKNHVEKVDYLRQEIKEVTENIGPLVFKEFQFAYMHLCEARMRLGFELQRIRESK
jgi:hypothetical protein